MIGEEIERVNNSNIETVTYKTLENGEGLALDIYPPYVVNDKKSPILLFVHGGSWIEGDRTGIRAGRRPELTDDLRGKGYTIISVDYRLINERVNFPMNIIDCKDALRWIQKNGEKYNFDIDNVGIWGASAGSHLAMMAAYSSNDQFIGDQDLANYSAKVHYIIDYYGPTELGSLVINICEYATEQLKQQLLEGIEIITGKQLGYDELVTNKDKFNPISPIYLLNEEVIPTLVIQGDKDMVVPMEQSNMLYKAFERKGLLDKLTYYIIEDGIHEFLKEGKLTEEKQDFVIQKTLEFILKQ